MAGAVIVVTGAGGFIGGHLVRRLVEQGETVRAVDVKPLAEWWQTPAPLAWNDSRTDLREPDQARRVLTGASTVYHLAANMGGMGFITSAETDIMHDSALVNLHTFAAAAKAGVKRLFFASSVCVYPDMPAGADPVDESGAYPAHPDNEYGWEKLYAERVAAAYGRSTGMAVRIARFENTYGPLGTWREGREKAPAAICRKVAEAGPGGIVEVWGDGSAVRSFTYVDDLVDGIVALTASDLDGPVNLGSPQYVTVDELVGTVVGVAGFPVEVRHVPGPVGVAARNFSTERARSLGWSAPTSLVKGLARTYPWVAEQVRAEGLRLSQ